MNDDFDENIHIETAKDLKIQLETIIRTIEKRGE